MTLIEVSAEMLEETILKATQTIKIQIAKTTFNFYY